MSLDRRQFLRLLSATGFAAGGLMGGSTLFPSRAAASTPGQGFDGPYVLTLHAGGGWDPTLLCDPKGLISDEQADPVNKSYYRDDIETVGPFKLAPVNNNVELFQKIRDDLLVINGVDTQTNSHETGTRHTWSGSMDPGTPALAAAYAGLQPERLTMGLLSNGGYDATGGLVPPTRLPSISAIEDLAYPDRLDGDDSSSTLHTDATLARLAAARDARMTRLQANNTLPRWQRAFERFAQSRAGDNELANLTNYLPDDLDGGSDVRRQAQVAMACFKAGVTASATLSVGGFDTHGNHDDMQTDALGELMDGFAFAIEEAERQGILDKVIFVVGSDFARTPWYNDGNGKDHWSITSMMLMGPGIRGGRVVGATDDYQVPRLVDPKTLNLSDTGVRITPGHVHAALRELLGIANDPALISHDVGTSLPLL